ncbi:Asp-tRNA(Asn)/Glu-tRNA(Gln) amidotransferase GatCAB subunit B [bacterium]|nr:MAG: Asp-tRNA(Asn)/Glu-tRNA(Gln) amidotransferase GatCAB subunit B [bacterium]
MEFEAVIGMELHVQLKTETKLFCSCRVEFGAPPNKNVCPVCLGMPGVLPVLNKKAVEHALRVAIALNCRINKESLFARKNYFYPDLPKGYQITQYTTPIGWNGWIDVNGKKIRIKRVHLEEESAKTVLEGDYAYIDFNRAGIPLVEIVTEPDLTSPGDAVQFVKTLQTLLRYLGVSDADMEKGQLRCEPNVSVRRRGDEKLGTRREIKNLNSIRSLERGIRYEIEQQIKILSSGGEVERATLLWDEKEEVTRPMRMKEEEEDYRYFPEPDLPPLLLTEDFIKEIRKTMPELPHERKERLIKEGLREYDADILTRDLERGRYYDEVVSLTSDPPETAKWVITELKEKFPPARELAWIINAVKEGKITRNAGKEILKEIIEKGKPAEEIVKEKGMTQVSDEEEIRKLVEQAFEMHPEEKERLFSGERKLVGFFIGEVMKLSGRRANPGVVKRMIEEMLG